MNFKIIKSRFDSVSYHLYCLDDKCLYKKNGKGKEVQYYTCIGKNQIDDAKCQVSGKVYNQKFVRLNNFIEHNHEDHEVNAEVEVIKHQIKIEVKETTTPISSIFRNHTKK